MRYYINTTRTFPMSLDKQKGIVKRQGGYQVRTAKLNGMYNGVQVVTFDVIHPDVLTRISAELPFGYTIREKDWK